jgi:hypothetical protein
VLELGCGTGRVALHLAGAGTGDRRRRDPELVARCASGRRAAGRRQSADAREFGLSEFALTLAPMQLLQLLAGPGRARALPAPPSPRHLGRAARALRSSSGCPPREEPPPLPDVREVDGWVYSSLPSRPPSTRRDRSSAACARRSRPTGAERGADEVRIHSLGERWRPRRGGRPAPAAGARSRHRHHVGSTVVLLAEEA